MAFRLRPQTRYSDDRPSLDPMQNFERTLAYRHLFSPETLARLEAYERGEPMPAYPDEWHKRQWDAGRRRGR